MPLCCPNNIRTFNEAVTNVAYTPELAAVYGEYPKIEVMYLVGGEYRVSGTLTAVSFDGSMISVDHGGVQRGLLKLS